MNDTALAERTLTLTENAARRIATLKQTEGNDKLMLRLAVTGGGCSGFSYSFSLEDHVNEDDRTFVQHGITVVVDEMTLDLVAGSTIDFVEDLVGSAFQVQNPNAASTCGCGNSFSV